jgi:hypothetical protein
MIVDTIGAVQLYLTGNLSQNPVSANLRFDGKGYGGSGLKPASSAKSKVAFPKTEVLGKAPGIAVSKCRMRRIKWKR